MVNNNYYYYDKKNNNNNNNNNYNNKKNNSKYNYYWYFIHTDQNRHPSTEHDQYKVAGGSSTCYRGIVRQTSQPQGRMGKVTGSFFTKQWAWYCLAFSSYCTSGAC